MTSSNTPFLDSIDLLNQIDENNALQSIEELGSQVVQIWNDVQTIKIPASYAQAKTVVVAGMGGSILGTDVVKSVFADQLSVPIIIAPDYSVPAFVGKSTLVIVSSYSGNTEETLAAAKDAHDKGALLLAITTGGKIADFFEEHGLPILKYDTKHNPSNSPRMGLGYSLFGQIALFAKAGLITFSDEDYQSILDAIALVHTKASVHIPQEKNMAKVIAFNMLNKIPVITVSEHLEGAAHVFANQLNENAKTFAEYRVVPELNHHLLEGFQYPESADSVLEFFTFQSRLYHSQNQIRMTLTEEVISEHKLECISHQLESSSKLAQAFELVTLGAYSAFYLAMLHHINPIPNPQVDWFKAELAKRSET